ncbi:MULTISPECIES: hypothetical protein [Saccharibacillus]|uniref:Uncharacterized protein n=1 Tax=Saccharibacillus brassicae TaxID=2583377 RepID=A0A4Y6V0U9_SACBS|nr:MULTISPECIES: hypothetical protein [Saccharibacillus]MWJ30713.1 hypothetical protein [Saccharibacillus sp. WB 17]QDH22380.1 hypothetical protein FFV09_16945 [Saccharibacillus brassicae]
MTPSASDDAPTPPVPSPTAPWIVICAHCSQIRRPDGWRIPAFGECNGAVLTHDICPDCIRALYPQYASVADRLHRDGMLPNPYAHKKAQTP